MQIQFGYGFVESDPDGLVIEMPEIDQGFGRLREDRIASPAERHPERIKAQSVCDLETKILQSECQSSNLKADALRDLLQSIGAVVDGIAGSDYGQ